MVESARIELASAMIPVRLFTASNPSRPLKTNVETPLPPVQAENPLVRAATPVVIEQRERGEREVFDLTGFKFRSHRIHHKQS